MYIADHTHKMSLLWFGFTAEGNQACPTFSLSGTDSLQIYIWVQISSRLSLWLVKSSGRRRTNHIRKHGARNAVH
jgi:hypothetical protein